MKVYLRIFLFAVSSLAAASGLSAGVQIFDLSDETEAELFQAGVKELKLLQSEVFDSELLGPEESAELRYILAPGQESGPFPTGTSEVLGITFQVNMSGDDPSLPNWGGSLFAQGGYWDGFIRIGPESSHHSLDIILDPPDYRRAVQGFVFTIYGNDTPGTVRLYTPNNELLGSGVYENVGNETGKQIGVLATGDTFLFRVNYSAPKEYSDVSQPSIYVIPEPATTALALGAGLLVLVALFRYRIAFSA